jgi:hypothetical protein
MKSANYAGQKQSYPQETEFAQPGVYIAECQIPPLLLNTGNFSTGVALSSIDHGTKILLRGTRSINDKGN